MQFVISKDEYWPFRRLETPNEHNVKWDKVATIPDDKVEWINATMEEFEKVQSYLESLKGE